LLVVKKTWLMCPDKATVRRPSTTESSSAFRPMGVSFWSLGSRNGLEAPPRYAERFGKRMDWVGLLFVKKTCLMCPYKVTVRCVWALAS